MEVDERVEPQKIIITTTSRNPYERLEDSFPKCCANLTSSFGDQSGVDKVVDKEGDWSAFCKTFGGRVKLNGTTCLCESCHLYNSKLLA